MPPTGRREDRPASGTVRATRQAEYTANSKTETYGSFETQGRHADRRIRHARDAFARTHGVHTQGQDGPRGGLPDGQGGDLPPDPAAPEPGHVRHDLHGRPRHPADERGDQRQLHRRDGVPARGRHVRPLPEHPRQPLEHAREGAVEDRRTGHRLVGGLHAGRRGGLAPLAQPPQDCRQALRQTQPGDEFGLPGRLGEVLPAVADRAAHRADRHAAPDARHRGGAQALRREYDLHRADRRRHLVGARRRHREARQGARRLQPPDRI